MAMKKGSRRGKGKVKRGTSRISAHDRSNRRGPSRSNAHSRRSGKKIYWI